MKGQFLLVLIVLFSWGIQAQALIPSTNDVWDVSNGTIVLSHSNLGFGTSAEDMFGATSGGVEPGDTLFSDYPPDDGIHFVEWKTANPVALSSIAIFAGGDGEIYQNEREFSRITIKAKSSPSSAYDTIIYDLPVSHPYRFQESASALLTNVVLPAPITAQSFRAEFVNFIAGREYDGPRLIELDGFGQMVPIVSITQQPLSQKVAGGTTVTFDIAASPATDLTYQWLFNGNPLIGATNSSLKLTNVAQTAAGLYSVELANGQGTLLSETAMLEVAIATITAQPSNQQVNEGATANFTVGATSTSDLKYQWLFNGSIIPGATNSTLSLTNASLASRGIYSVKISTPWGTVPSSGASLEIIPLPRINFQPASQQVIAGVTVQFRVVASSATPIHYQWFHDDTLLPGQTNSTLSLVNVSTNASGLYSVDVSNVAGTVSSVSATLTVRLPPVLAFKPSNDDVWDVSRGTIVLTNSPLRSGDARDMFGAISPGDEPGYTLFSDIPPEDGIHFVEWQTANPVEVSSLSIFAAGDSEAYQNEREFSRITIKAKSSPASGFDTIVYDLLTTHPYQMQDFESALLTNVVFQTPITAQSFRAEFVNFVAGRGYDGPRIIELDAFGDSRPIAEITVQPLSQQAEAGTTVTFSVTAISTNELAYQWLFNGGIIPNATNSTLLLTNLTLAAQGFYTVELSNSFGSISSAGATLQVLPVIDHIAPTITLTSPTNLTVTTDNNLVLSGTVVDNLGSPTAQFDLNGSISRLLLLQANGAFSTNISGLIRGTNILTVYATDSDGNEATNSVTLILQPKVSLIIQGAGPYQEGSRIVFPVVVSSSGDISGATFGIQYDTNVLADAALSWQSPLDGAFTLINTNRPGELDAAFALAGLTLRGGDLSIAEISFRARSVPVDTDTVLDLNLMGVYDNKGDSINSGLFSQGTVTRITRRQIIADNNGNNRLDIADASVLMRFVTQLDPIQPWDVAENDLNSNNSLDSGDVIKLLRVVVGLDPQPQASGNLFVQHASALALAGANFQLTASESSITAGDFVTVRLEIANNSDPLSGTSFRLQYPTNALRLVNAQSLRAGAIVPASAAILWNVSPSQNDFSVQDGSIIAGISSAASWTTVNGAVAEFTFQVQPGAASDLFWPVTVTQGEISTGFQVEPVANAKILLQGRAPVPLNLVKFDNGSVELRVEGANGKTFVVEYSSDLRTWTPIPNGMVTLSSNGFANVSDSSDTNLNYRFYRVIEVSP